MKTKKELESEHRRAFIKKAGLGVGAVGAVAIGLPETSKAVPAIDGKPGGSGYRETEHVKRFYETARF